MPCYQCSHCNKCGMYSMKLDLRCATCGEPVPAGMRVCARCGAPFKGNTTRGTITKPGLSADDVAGLLGG